MSRSAASTPQATDWTAKTPDTRAISRAGPQHPPEDVTYGALPCRDFTHGSTDYEIQELTYTTSWRTVRLRMYPALEGAGSRTVLRFGSDLMTFAPSKVKTSDYRRTKDEAVQQCREYDWDQQTIGWSYNYSVSVKMLTRAGVSRGRSVPLNNPGESDNPAQDDSPA